MPRRKKTFYTFDFNAFGFGVDVPQPLFELTGRRRDRAEVNHSPQVWVSSDIRQPQASLAEAEQTVRVQMAEDDHENVV